MPEIDLGSVVGPVGPQGATGAKGDQGIQGPPGAPATINGVNALTMTAGPNVKLTQTGSSLEIGAVVPGENLLINSHLANPVNQKGQTEYELSAKGYGFDMWYQEAGAKAELTSDGVIFTPFPTTYNLFAQYVEQYKDLIGKQLTLSILVKENTCSNCLLWFYGGTVDNFASIVLGEPGVYSVTMTPNSSINSLRCGVQGRNSTGSVKIEAFKLEPGPVQTLAHKEPRSNYGETLPAGVVDAGDGTVWVLNDPPPNKALELLKCQRHAIKLLLGEIFAGAMGSSNTDLTFFIPLPVTPRTNPAHFTVDVGISVGTGSHNTTFTSNRFILCENGIRVGGTIAKAAGGAYSMCNVGLLGDIYLDMNL